ncbi:MAG: hypothetical protein WKF87_21090 [Chryseolinea sp.]
MIFTSVAPLTSIFFTVVILISCGPSTPSLEGIDVAKWKSDLNGCGGERALAWKQLELQKEKLIGLAELDVVALLGKPDRNELSTRNQKFYYYFLEPAASCAPNSLDHEPARLAIRFNAMGLAKEVRVEQDYGGERGH